MDNINLNLLTDEELMELVQKHKYKAFKELVARYSSDLFNFSYYFTYNREITKKIIKNLFISIWQEPYLYIEDFKISVYKKVIKRLSKEHIDKEIYNSNKKILSSLAQKDILNINLYYFSTLKEKEIKLFNKNINKEIEELNKSFIEKYDVDLYTFIYNINMNNLSILEFQKEIMATATKYQQKDKNQNIVIGIGIIPLIALVIMIIYSISYRDEKTISKHEDTIKLFEYLFVK